jgi:hypothetical protein
MHAIVFVTVYYLVPFVAAAFAFQQGERGDRLGAVWFCANILFGGLFELLGLSSPTMHLVTDGIFATGLLPLAIIYASYWVGALCLIASALFTLEAVYLIDERAIDHAYAIANNALLLSTPAVLMISGGWHVFQRWQKRRGATVQSINAGHALG